MRLLLDSHVLVWYKLTPDRIRPAVLERICDRANEAFHSAVSFCELAINRSVGRLSIDLERLAREIREDGIEELPITSEHGLVAGTLPRIHKDPFDRLLVAQACVEGLTIVTSDQVLMRYPVATLAA